MIVANRGECVPRMRVRAGGMGLVCILLLTGGSMLAGCPGDANAETIIDAPVEGFATGDTASPLARRWRAAIAADRPEAFRRLLLHSRDAATLVNARSSSGKTALMIAAKYCDAELVERLLDGGADPDARTAAGGSPLMFAALGGDAALVQRLHRAGARLDAVGSNGWDALMLAAAKGHVAVLEWLIGAGSDPNRADIYAFTPLMRAIDNGHRDIVERLLAEPGIAIDAVDETGNSALHHAVAADDRETVARLLAADADPAIANRRGERALDAGR